MKDSKSVPFIQILLRSDQRPCSMRDLGARDVNQLLSIPGIVIAATRSRAKATYICAQCKQCDAIKMLEC